jgi:hypothetical protein
VFQYYFDTGANPLMHNSTVAGFRTDRQPGIRRLGNWWRRHRRWLCAGCSVARAEDRSRRGFRLRLPQPTRRVDSPSYCLTGNMHRARRALIFNNFGVASRMPLCRRVGIA